MAFVPNLTLNGGSVELGNTSGSATGSGTLTVVTGAFLTGSGTAGGALIANGTVSPGTTSTGTLATTGNTTFNSGVLHIAINDSASPKSG